MNFHRDFAELCSAEERMVNFLQTLLSSKLPINRTIYSVSVLKYLNLLGTVHQLSFCVLCSVLEGESANDES